MLHTYTHKELLDVFKRRYGVAAAAGVATATDASQLDMRLGEEIEAWYSLNLHTADPALLPKGDLASEAGAVRRSDRCVEVTLPARCARPLRVKLKGWDLPVGVISEGAREVERVLGAFSCLPSDGVPVALWLDGTLTLYGACPEPPVVESLLSVVAPPAGFYILDPQLLEKI